LVALYLAQALLTSANSASMLKTEIMVGLEIGFFTNGFFTSGYRLSGPRVLCRIGRIVCLSGVLATAPEALGSIGLPRMSSMIFVSATIWFFEIAHFLIFDASHGKLAALLSVTPWIAATNLRLCHVINLDQAQKPLPGCEAMVGAYFTLSLGGQIVADTLVKTIEMAVPAGESGQESVKQKSKSIQRTIVGPDPT
jgi:hypothetical protein